MTITLEHVPVDLSNALELRARKEGKSVADVAMEILSHGITVDPTPPIKRRDLSEFVGTMSKEDALAIEETVRWMDAGDLANRE